MKKIFLSFSLMLLVSAGVWPQENAFGGKYVNAFKADSVVWKCYNENTHKFCETILHGDTVVDGKKWKILQSNCLIVLKGLIRTEGDKVLFTPYPGYENMAIDDSADYLGQVDQYGELFPEVEQSERVKITGYYPDSVDIEAVAAQANERLAELDGFGLETGDIHDRDRKSVV